MAVGVIGVEGAPVRAPVRWSAVAAGAGAVLVAALVGGALVVRAAPPPLSSRLRVHEYFVSHHDAALNQSVLIHGVAGLALAALVAALWRMFAESAWAGVARRVLLVAGSVAAAASFFQLWVVLNIEHHIEHEVGVRRTDALFDALNRACAVKLVALAVAVAAATWLLSKSPGFRRSVARVGYVAVPVLLLAALALVAKGPAFRTLVWLWVPTAVVWAGATAASIAGGGQSTL
ncbi:MAG: hypothetical protein JO086_09950 [Acidimicrobiia bacterium]|nr:hypothetical protein [Acidimicrobiia bacterium]